MVVTCVLMIGVRKTPPHYARARVPLLVLFRAAFCCRARCCLPLRPPPARRAFAAPRRARRAAPLLPCGRRACCAPRVRARRARACRRWCWWPRRCARPRAAFAYLIVPRACPCCARVPTTPRVCSAFTTCRARLARSWRSVDAVRSSSPFTHSPARSPIQDSTRPRSSRAAPARAVPRPVADSHPPARCAPSCSAPPPSTCPPPVRCYGTRGRMRRCAPRVPRAARGPAPTPCPAAVFHAPRASFWSCTSVLPARAFHARALDVHAACSIAVVPWLQDLPRVVDLCPHLPPWNDAFLHLRSAYIFWSAFHPRTAPAPAAGHRCCTRTRVPAFCARSAPRALRAPGRFARAAVCAGVSFCLPHHPGCSVVPAAFLPTRARCPAQRLRGLFHRTPARRLHVPTTARRACCVRRSSSRGARAPAPPHRRQRCTPAFAPCSAFVFSMRCSFVFPFAARRRRAARASARRCAPPAARRRVAHVCSRSRARFLRARTFRVVRSLPRSHFLRSRAQRPAPPP